MATLTQKAIMASCLKLLDSRPISKVSIKDIVEDCGISRNTFYYHFEDLPSLLEEIVCEEAARIIVEYSNVKSLAECMEIALQFFLQHKQAAMNIYRSGNRDIFDRYLMEICRYAVEAYIEPRLEEAEISEFDREIILQLYRCECFGLLMDWYAGGMSEGDMRSKISRICSLCEGTLNRMIEKSEG